MNIYIHIYIHIYVYSYTNTHICILRYVIRGDDKGDGEDSVCSATVILIGRVYICVYIYVHTHLSIYVYVDAYTNEFKCILIYDERGRIWICSHIYKNIDIRTSIHLNTHKHTLLPKNPLIINTIRGGGQTYM
jgi:hypothetical protein